MYFLKQIGHKRNIRGTLRSRYWLELSPGARSHRFLAHFPDEFVRLDRKTVEFERTRQGAVLVRAQQRLRVRRSMVAN